MFNTKLAVLCYLLLISNTAGRKSPGVFQAQTASGRCWKRSCSTSSVKNTPYNGDANLCRAVLTLRVKPNQRMCIKKKTISGNWRVTGTRILKGLLVSTRHTCSAESTPVSFYYSNREPPLVVTYTSSLYAGSTLPGCLTMIFTLKCCVCSCHIDIGKRREWVDLCSEPLTLHTGIFIHVYVAVV